MFACMHVIHICNLIYAILLQLLCILVSVVVVLCLSCLLKYAHMHSCICSGSSCVLYCMSACIVCLLVFAVLVLYVCLYLLVLCLCLCLSCACACACIVSACICCACIVCLLVLCHDCACACIVCLLVFVPPPCTSNSNTTVATVVRASIAMYLGLCQTKTKQTQEGKDVHTSLPISSLCQM